MECQATHLGLWGRVRNCRNSQRPLPPFPLFSPESARKSFLFALDACRHEAKPMACNKIGIFLKLLLNFQLVLYSHCTIKQIQMKDFFITFQQCSPLDCFAFILYPFPTVQYNSDQIKIPFPPNPPFQTHFKRSNYYFVCFDTMFLCISHSHLQTVFSSYMFQCFYSQVKYALNLYFPIR